MSERSETSETSLAGQERTRILLSLSAGLRASEDACAWNDGTSIFSFKGWVTVLDPKFCVAWVIISKRTFKANLRVFSKTFDNDLSFSYHLYFSVNKFFSRKSTPRASRTLART